MRTLRRITADPRFRVMAVAIVTAVAAYLTAVLAAGAPVP